MGRVTYSVGFTADRLTTFLEIQEDAKPLAHIVLDGAETQSLIAKLAMARAGLTDAVAARLDPGSRVPTEQSPGWHVSKARPPAEGVLLTLRHPGIGWLGFILESGRARAIAKVLRLHSSQTLENKNGP